MLKRYSFVGGVLLAALSLHDVAAQEVTDGFILIEGGDFYMGSPEDERQRASDEERHKVTIASFYVDPYEVTQKDYEAVMGSNPSFFKGENRPVENVSWFDAIEYCNRLSKISGLTEVYRITDNSVIFNRKADGYRLLTEAEWEYIARAGTDSVYYFGNQVHSDLVNFEGSYPYLIEENYVHRQDSTVRTSAYRAETINVDELPPNPWGLYNILGNVSEWVFDYYEPFTSLEASNPAGPGQGTLRVNRGGAYNDFGKHLRASYRSAANPNIKDQNTGFRICRNAAPQEGEIITSPSFTLPMPDKPRILTAYFSWSGNTKSAALLLAQKTGADVVEITMQTPYRGNIYDVSQKDLNAAARPKINLSLPLETLDNYDVILLGFPTWWATLPMPMMTFLESFDFKGKLVLPFSSHGGTRLGDSTSDLAKEIPNAVVMQPFEFYYSGGRSLSEELSAWLELNGIKGFGRSPN